MEIFQENGNDLLFVAVGKQNVTGWDDGQELLVVDMKDLSTKGSCALLQSIELPRHICDTPHDMAIDPATGNLFVACVAINGPDIVRFTTGY